MSNGKRSALALVAMCAALAGAVSPAEAGLFEVLFGNRAAPPASNRPLAVHVRPRGTVQAGRPDVAVRPDAAARVRREPSATPRRVKESRVFLQRGIDPVREPEWHLKDPTLRRGDIVVLATGAKVFMGRGGARLADTDFASLGKASGIGRAERLKVEAMVSGRWLALEEPPEGSEPRRPRRRVVALPD